MKRIGRRDSRYHTERWKRTSRAILQRDHWQCQIRGPRCRGTATQTDHILSAHPDLGGADFWDPTNLRAACGPCNNGRNNPGFLSGTYTPERPLANLSLRSRFGPVRSDYSRRPADDGDRSP